MTEVWATGPAADGFTEVEYITFDGTQYINTGISATSNTKVTIDFQYSSLQGWNLMFGARGSGTCNNTMMFGLDGNYDGYAYWYGGSNCSYPENLFQAYANTNRHTVVMNNNTVSVDGQTPATVTSNAPTTPSLFLGAMRESNGSPYGGASNNYKGRIYTATIDKDGDADDRNFVPVRCNAYPSCEATTNPGRRADYGEYGLYDTLNDVFYGTTAGTLGGATVPALTVSGISPSSGSAKGGDTVLINGTGHPAARYSPKTTGSP
jgi:hypothetical protein